MCVSDVALTFSIMVLGGFFHGLIGFGFPMIATPLLSLLGSVQSAVLTTLLPTLSVNATSIGSQKGSIGVLRRFWPLGIFIVLGSWSGTQLLVRYDTEIYKLLLAGMIVMYLFQSKLNFDLSRVIASHFYLSMIFFGLASGVVSGLVNIMIPVLIIYVLELGLKKIDGIVLMNFCFLSSKLTQIVTFTWLGVFTWETLFWGVPAAALAVGALLLGKKLTHKINTHVYTKILRVTLWLMAGLLLAQYMEWV